ncbi:MAG: hypothetical protein LAP13_07100 [Acidobacteriia bacterium]|nr:hypothetical protein [Terriglobia bacterium]
MRGRPSPDVRFGHGTARDVRRLADLLRARVQQKFGITLEEEIRYF